LEGGSGATSFNAVLGVEEPPDFADDANDAAVGELCIELRPRDNETLGDAGMELAAFKAGASKLVFSTGELWPLKLGLASGDG